MLKEKEIQRLRAKNCCVSETETSDILSLREVFAALVAVDGARAYLLGRDDWRLDITDSTGKKLDSLSVFDPELALAVSRQARSKGGNWNRPDEWNIWPAVHIGLLLPSIGYVLRLYGEQGLDLTHDETAKFWSGFPYARKHCVEYKEFEGEYKQFNTTVSNIRADKKRSYWDQKLDECFKEIDPDADLWVILTHLPEPFFEKVTTALNHRDNPNAENDSLIGRIVLAYLADRKDVPLEKLNMDTRVKGYLSAMADGKPEYGNKPRYVAPTLYERLVNFHMEEIPKLLNDVPILAYKKDASIPIAEFSRMYRWYGTSKNVEMVKPDLVGASQLGVGELSALFHHLEEKHGLDVHDRVVMKNSIKLFRETQSLKQVGRLSLMMDLLDAGTNIRTGGEALRTLAGRVWNTQERQKEWGNQSFYIPESRESQRDFATFRQDIGNILYLAGLVEEREGSQKQANALKKLACASRDANSLHCLCNLIITDSEVIKKLEESWQDRYPSQEKVRIVRFVKQTFGLEPVKSIPIPHADLQQGLSGSYANKCSNAYHLRYREADDRLALDVYLPVPAHRSLREVVAYHTDASAPLLIDGIAHSAWLDVVSAHGTLVRISVAGRGSPDPFGTTGSPHAGEIIGYGCSVHHATLAVTLAELASLGAGRSVLEQVKEAFLQINPGVHMRCDLASFQVAQTSAAFEEAKVLTYRKYLESHPEIYSRLQSEPGHNHLMCYLHHPERQPVEWSAQTARLAFGYPDLYPDSSICDPPGSRHSWYNSENVEFSTKELEL